MIQTSATSYTQLIEAFEADLSNVLMLDGSLSMPSMMESIGLISLLDDRSQISRVIADRRRKASEYDEEK